MGFADFGPAPDSDYQPSHVNRARREGARPPCSIHQKNAASDPALNRRAQTGQQNRRGGLARTSEVNICRVVRESPNVRINETRVQVVWDEPMPSVKRPWFAEGAFLYLRDPIACAHCHKLQT